MAIEKAESVYKKNVIWNAVAGLINAGEAVVILAVISRVNGLRDAGVLTLAFSLANLFMMIGKFGMRSYQVAHDGIDFSFKTFLYSRIITVTIMFLASLGYVLYYFVENLYTIEKCIVIFLVCMWYAVEAFEDVFIGKYQSMGRLDIGSRLFSIRWIITILTFIVTDILSKNIVSAAAYALGVELIFGIAGILYLCKKYRYDKAKCTITDRGLKVLFKESVFLCSAAFLSYYVVNIPKYAINAYLGDEVQAIYGYISMPVFVISLLNGFVYQPQLITYISEWNENKITLFIARVVRQLAVVALLVIICVLGALILGIPVLSILYHENLEMYKVHLLILLVGGGFLAAGAFFANMLVIINEQRRSMCTYLLLSIIGYLIINGMVKKFSLLGAVWGYTITMMLMTLLFMGAFARIIWRKLREKT